MTREELLEWSKSFKLEEIDFVAFGYIAELKEAIKSYIGKNNPFYEELERIIPPWNSKDAYQYAHVIFIRFIKMVEKDYISQTSIKRKLQTEIESDFIELAITLLEEKDVHPAAAAILAGAVLEDYLIKCSAN